MKEQMMHWQDGCLVLTPNRCYAPRAIRAIAAGLCLWILGIYLAARFGDFWQLPFAVGLCLLAIAVLYKIFSADIKVYIPSGQAEIEMSYGFYYIRKIILKKEAAIVKNSLNQKPYFALSKQSNPYGSSYQISPFLTDKTKSGIFEDEVLPAIEKQLNMND